MEECRKMHETDIEEFAPKRKVLIYRDTGCADLTMLEKCLKEYFVPQGVAVHFVSADEIIKKNALDRSVVAFFMPGGASTPYRHKLEVLGNEKIRRYVYNGGLYYGICAGAYYACQKTIFEQEIPQSRIVSECGLNLIAGQAVGTLYRQLNIQPYSKSIDSAAAVDLIWNDSGEKFVSHYHGGSFFTLRQNKRNKVLAYYDLEGKPPAIVLSAYGRGAAVISGVHYENSGADLLKVMRLLHIDSPKGYMMAEKLQKNESQRQNLVAKLLSFCAQR